MTLLQPMLESLESLSLDIPDIGMVLLTAAFIMRDVNNGWLIR